MKIIKIPKKNNAFRTICCPSQKMRMQLRDLLFHSLNKKQAQYCDKEIVHGFILGKSIVTNAKTHVGFNYTTSFDIKDFFDSVKPEHVQEYLTEEEIKQVFIENHAWQGLPTSPCVANLAAVKLDKNIKDFISTLGDKVVYTRYADDLNFSHNEHSTYLVLKEKIPELIKRNGFEINKGKLRLQDARYGRREITGIYVDKEKIYVSRKIKRKIRAAKHQKNVFQLEGLEEFAKLKLPNYTVDEQLNNLLKTAQIQLTSAKIAKYHNLSIYGINALIRDINNLGNKINDINKSSHINWSHPNSKAKKKLFQARLKLELQKKRLITNFIKSKLDRNYIFPYEKLDKNLLVKVSKLNKKQQN